MKRLCEILLIFVCLSSSVYAEKFKVWETEIEVPPPAGFVRVTPDLPRVYQMAEMLAKADPKFEQLGFYITKEDAAAARAGESPEIRRKFFLRVMKNMAQPITGDDRFQEIQENTRANNDPVIEDFRSRDPKFYDRIVEQVKQETGSDLDLKFSQFIPFKEHHASSNIFSFSMLFEGTVSDGVRSRTEFQSCTTTFLNPAGKVIYLYCYAPHDELAWNREASLEWAQAIMKVNPAAPEKSPEKPQIPDEKKLQSNAVAKILLGILLVTAMLLYLFRRNRPHKTATQNESP